MAQGLRAYVLVNPRWIYSERDWPAARLRRRSSKNCRTHFRGESVARKGRSVMKRYLASAICGAVLGGVLVAVATNTIPKITAAMRVMMDR